MNPETTLADYRQVYGDRYTDEELERLRTSLRGLARLIVRQAIAEAARQPEAESR